jgi:hypothetical protein
VSELKLVSVPGANAIAEWKRLRAEYPSTGLYPVLLGEREESERIEERADYDGRAVAQILKASEEIDPVAWFRERPEDSEEPDDSGPEGGRADEDRAEDEDDDGLGHISSHKEVLSEEFKPKVLIGLFRVAAPWEVFALLGWGGWNGNPGAEEHCAVHSYWADMYGAEVVSVTDDVVECRVARPPLDRPAAAELAAEQYAYCPDIVDQGCGTVTALTATLQGSRYWYFWWD